MSLTDATRRAAAAGEVSCPECQHPLPYYDAANSAFFACPNCATYFEEQTGQPPKIRGRFVGGPNFVRQALPLGAEGLLPDGRRYRVVGYMAKHEQKSADYRWGEYVLLSAPDQYAQLAVYDGHWQFIRPDATRHQIRKPNSREAEVGVGDDTFELYNKYSPRLQYAAGEFSWNILDDHLLTVQEFVAPPYQLSYERNGQTKKAEWYRAEHLEPRQVAQAFDVPASALPYRRGVGAAQPAPGEATWQPLLTFTLVMALAAVVAQLVIGQVRPARQLLAQDFVTAPDPTPTATAGQGAVLMTRSFEVERPTALDVDLRVGVDNQWLELPVTLINEQTGQNWEFTKTIEYYHGNEGGESWSEGSTAGSATLTGIPRGRYHLNLYPQAENSNPLSVSLTVEENPSLPSNLLLLLLLLFAWPVLQFLRRRYHHQQRWANSDYGPQE